MHQQQDNQVKESKEWISLTEAAEGYGVAKSTISRIVKKHQIETMPDPVVSTIRLIDKKHLISIMSASMRYTQKKLS